MAQPRPIKHNDIYATFPTTTAKAHNEAYLTHALASTIAEAIYTYMATIMVKTYSKTKLPTTVAKANNAA